MRLCSRVVSLARACIGPGRALALTRVLFVSAAILDKPLWRQQSREESSRARPRVLPRRSCRVQIGWNG
eukprot:6993228-Alexandrium_andersonii.AAC.1